ncbi:MAG: hypothetical protein WCF46_07495, partial [Nitrososphaeraceae archaeon]
MEALEKMTNYGAEDEPHRRVAGNFALYSAAGTKSGSMVYFEIEPGFVHLLGRCSSIIAAAHPNDITAILTNGKSHRPTWNVYF